MLGTCIRRLPGPGRTLHLTFDDGPDEQGTPAVLELLAAAEVRATFFVVAERARRHPALLRRISEQGHAIGNHSLNHRWGAFFGGARVLRDWVAASERALADQLGHATVGFRSPAGVQTPQLRWALEELGLPLIHWNVRFYDAVWRWREERALASLHRTPPGSIVLLHDRQRPEHLGTFLATLRVYAEAAREAGFTLAPISPEAVGAALKESGNRGSPAAHPAPETPTEVALARRLP